MFVREDEHVGNQMVRVEARRVPRPARQLELQYTTARTEFKMQRPRRNYRTLGCSKARRVRVCMAGGPAAAQTEFLPCHGRCCQRTELVDHQPRGGRTEGLLEVFVGQQLGSPCARSCCRASGVDRRREPFE